jgi:hypothetical protein
VRPGDLVRVVWGGALNRQRELGEVIRYEPDHHGGSWMYTARWGRNAEHDITVHPKRARVLVLTYSDGGMSWWDEKDIEPVGEEDGM